MAADRLVTQVSEWLLTYAIHSTALLLAVAFLARHTRNERSLERLWRIGLLGPLLTTTLQNLAPSWFATLILSPGGPGASPVAREIVLAPATGGLSNAIIAAAWLALGTWVVIALGGIVSLLLGHLRLLRLVRGRTPICVLSHPTLTNIRVARELNTPIALVSGELCLPVAAVNDLSSDELSAVIAHEQEHIRRRDPCWLLLSSLICRILFFQPLNWIAAARLRAVAEFLCDSSAVRQTSPVAVAGALVSVSHWIGRQPLVVAGMASHESLTVRRVRRILDGQWSTSRLGRMVPVAGVLLLSLAVIGPGVALESRGVGVRYTIAAHDDGGPFNVTIERGRVVEVSLNGSAVPTSEIRQQGNQVLVRPAGGATLELTLTAEGGMRWTSRPRANSLD